MNWGLITNFIIALLAIINPIGKIPLWLDASGDQSADVRSRLAALIVLTSGMVLILFFLFGKDVLNFFNIELASFKIGGGIVILQLGLSMLGGKAVDIEKEDLDDDAGVMQRVKSRFRQVVIPMAIPMIAGPGSITTVIIYGSRTESLVNTAAMCGILILTLVMVYFTMISGNTIKKYTGELPLMVITRLFGLILIAIAIQLIVEGLGEVFPSLIQSGAGMPQSEIMDDVQPDTSSVQ